MTASDVAPAGEHELGETEEGAWRGLLHAHAALVKALDAELEAAHGLPLSSYEVLLFLAQAPDHRLRMAELADRVLLSRSGMTRMVDRLERDGYIARDTCADDKRGSYAVLTERGAALLKQARPTHLAGVRRRFLAQFSDDELAQLSAFWGRLDLSPHD